MWYRWDENEDHSVISYCISQMLYSFLSNLIPREMQCGECLYKKLQMGIWNAWGEIKKNRISCQCTSQMLRTLVSDLITVEI